MRICTLCEIEKDEMDFYGRYKQCKSCVLEKRKQYREENLENIKIYKKKYFVKNKNSKIKDYRIANEENIKAYSKKYGIKYREENKEKSSIYNKEYKKENKEYFKEYSSQYYLNNKEKSKESYWKNIDKRRTYDKERSSKPERVLQKKISDKKYWRSEGYKKRRNSSPINAWRQLLKNTLKRVGQIKKEKTVILLGYSAIELKKHLESKFTEGMTWDNYGEWHIDHIKPLSSFDKNTRMNIVNALSNLQPLWAEDNLKKI